MSLTTSNDSQPCQQRPSAWSLSAGELTGRACRLRGQTLRAVLFNPELPEGELGGLDMVYKALSIHLAGQKVSFVAVCASRRIQCSCLQTALQVHASCHTARLSPLLCSCDW